MKRWPIITPERAETIKARYPTMTIEQVEDLAAEWGVTPTAIRVVANRSGIFKNCDVLLRNKSFGQRRRGLEQPVRPAPVKPSIASIVARVAEAHGVPVTQIRGDSRSVSIVNARREAMYLAYQTGAFSMPQVGHFFSRDHTTVLHAIRRYEAILAAEKAAA